MLSAGIFTIVLLFIADSKLEATQVVCEKLEGSTVIPGTRCFMDSTTTISAANVTLAGAQNFGVDGLIFSFNKQIEFLPVDAYKVYPNVASLLAKNCSIREISAKNFENLIGLIFVNLEGNHIKSIPNYCFRNLVLLSHLLLCESFKQTFFN